MCRHLAFERATLASSALLPAPSLESRPRHALRPSPTGPREGCSRLGGRAFFPSCTARRDAWWSANSVDDRKRGHLGLWSRERMKRRRISRARSRWPLAAALAMMACKGRDATPAPDLSPAPPAHAQVEDGGPQGGSTVLGSACGAAFTDVEAAYVIESPDSDGTTVIYLFSKPVSCIDLSFSGWERVIPNGTMVLQLKLAGKAPGNYLTVATTPPSAREAAAECMRTSPRGTTSDAPSGGGWITLDSLSARGPATGTFLLEFGAGLLTGRFSAAFCADGHEP